jgi:hypothetical protein
MQRAVHDVQRNEYSRRAACDEDQGTRYSRREYEQVRTRGAIVPIVLRPARTMPSMALVQVLTRGTVARRKPPLIGVQRMPATGDPGAHRADVLCSSWGNGY